MPGTEDDRQTDVQAPGQEGDYAQLLDDYSHFAPPSDGEVYKGTVLSVTDKEVIVDFGYKSEGLVPIEQFRAADGTISVHPGDVIDVMMDRSENRVEGYVLLSYERAHRLRAWDDLDKAMRENLTVMARVVAKTKGGLTVDVGVPAFMPGSQVAARPIYNLDQFVGTDIPVKVLKLNRRRGNVVVSRRLAVEEEEHSRKSHALEGLAEGSIVQGVVKNLTDYGAFVDLGGIDGLLHVSDMSFGRITHPSELIHVGDEIAVKVLKFDKEKERISLGMKQLSSNPWETVEERYPAGLRVIGRVVSVTDYGSFVELEPGVEGLIHISEMTWSRRMKHPSKVVRVGDQVEAVVLEVKPKERRVSLGIKQLEADPWTTVAERYSVGSVVEGRVRKLTDFGAFIEIEEGIDGLVHISDLSWTKRVGHPSEVLKKGQLVQAVVLHIDPDNRRLSLGVKQLQPDAWETFFRTFHVGDVVRGKVCRASNFGVFVEVSPGVEGLCHNSEVPDRSDRDKGAPPLPIGEEYDFKVIKLNEADKKIGLSLRGAIEEAERSRLVDYGRQAAAATSSVEDAMRIRRDEE
jgi:small subunit ribosomal protein S1